MVHGHTPPDKHKAISGMDDPHLFEGDRLGLDGEVYTILGRARPFLRLPVASGRNLALLIEIGARNELLKMQGYDAAKEFALKVDEQIAKNAQSPALRRPR